MILLHYNDVYIITEYYRNDYKHSSPLFNNNLNTQIFKKKKKKKKKRKKNVWNTEQNKKALQTQISDEGLSVSCDQERTH